VARPGLNELRRNFFQPVLFETIFARADAAVRYATRGARFLLPGA
jgi:hypothetical protein